MAQTCGDAWLYQELDDLKKIATGSLPDGGLALNHEADEQVCHKAEIDGIALANPYFP